MSRFSDHVVIVTGGAHGIGKATAEKFLSEGASVQIWDVNQEAGQQAAEEWEDQGWKASFAQVDVADFEAVTEAVSQLKEAQGSVDVLINNAGILRDKTLLKLEPEHWKQVLDVNLTGVFNCGKAAAEVMAEQESGVILNASSIVGLYGNYGQSNYVAAKSGVIGLTQTWARELGRKGIRVNAIAPGFIQTRMMDEVPENILDNLRKQTPLKRLGQPEDIANAYAYLASEEAAFITGTVLSVDGGLVI
jgi:3-oxoacyl-[acyl-carrier protein] reductase